MRRKPGDRSTGAPWQPSHRCRQPEEVFIDWLMSVPPDDCLEAAARYQIEIIDRSTVFLHPDVRHLRTLLVAVAGDGDWHKPISNL